MRKIALFVLLASLSAFSQTLVWNDEFNGPNGSQPDPTKWNMQNWYENTKAHELETYTNRPKNVDIWNGNLRIRIYRETYTGVDGITKNYTAGKIYTLGKFSATHGLWVARLKAPGTQGLHSAFWMVGADVVQVGWPTSGEIDIMENIGRQPYTNHGSLHGPPVGSRFAQPGVGAAFNLPTKLDAGYHLYAINWQPNLVQFYVDSKLYESLTPANFPPGNWVFEKPFYIIISPAIGDNWAGAPDKTTVLPQTMLVDYVRVYQ